jgi:hypothetical protein
MQTEAPKDAGNHELHPEVQSTTTTSGFPGVAPFEKPMGKLAFFPHLVKAPLSPLSSRSSYSFHKPGIWNLGQ